MSKSPIVLTGASLTIDALMRVAHGAPIALGEEARTEMQRSSQWLSEHGPASILAQKMGWLSGSEVGADDDALVVPFIQSHCAGVGKPLSDLVVRALIAARANVLATGLTGCRPAVADVLIRAVNENRTPVVPSQGSVGAAGSAALAHMVDGLFFDDCDVVLRGSEALALINGSTLATVLGAFAVHRSHRCLNMAIAATALTMEVVRADTAALSIQPMGARSDAAEAVAMALLDQLSGSTMVAQGRRPDPFSIRCAPAVIGTARSAVSAAEAVIRKDLNAANVNPLVRVDAQRVDEVGNFHGAEVAFVMDALKIALTTLASMSERRTFRLTYGQLSGLPSFLVRGTGLNSGLMIAQYTAASLVSECKVLSHPASVDAIPTVQHQEDHVSMAPIAARGALRILDALSEVLSIELICGAQGLDFRLEGTAVEDDGVVHTVAPLTAGKGTMVSYRFVRGVVARWVEDRALMPDLHAMAEAARVCGPSESPKNALPW